MTMRGIIYGLLVCDIFVAGAQRVAYHATILQDKYKKLAVDYTKKNVVNDIAVWLEQQSYIDANGYFVKKLFPVVPAVTTSPPTDPRVVEDSAFSRGVEVDVNNINIGD